MRTSNKFVFVTFWAYMLVTICEWLPSYVANRSNVTFVEEC